MPVATSPASPTTPVPDEQLAAHLAQDGFVHLGRVMDDATLAEVRADEERVREGREWDGNAHARTIFTHNVAWRSEPVRRFCQAGGHLGALRSLLGPDLLLYWTQFVTKFPDPDGGERSVFPWHQDCGYQDIVPTPVTVWVALDDVDERNGCVWLVPGSHRDGLRDHRKVSLDSWHLTLPVDGDGVAAPLRAGEAVAFTGYTLHRSLANRSALPRRAFFCEYVVPSARDARTGRPVLPDRDLMMVSGKAPW